MKASRNLWPYGLILTFVLFFAGMTTVVIIAATHRDSLVSENYYEQELRYQQQIDSAVRALKSGATITREVSRNTVVVTLPVALLTEKLSGKIEFYRPSASALDREFKLAPAADGTQTLDVSRLAPGLWRVRASWNADGHEYFLEQKITI